MQMLVTSLSKSLLVSICSLTGFKSFSLTSLELQMLTNSCVKLQTVHSVPLTINKEGEDLFLICFIKICLAFSYLLLYLKFVIHLVVFLPLDDESTGLYGFLNVIVHSATGLKQSLSKLSGTGCLT